MAKFRFALWMFNVAKSAPVPISILETGCQRGFLLGSDAEAKIGKCWKAAHRPMGRAAPRNAAASVPAAVRWPLY
jgi:hypothetical protein